MSNNQDQKIKAELIALTRQLMHESGDKSQREIKLDASLHRHLGIDSLARAELFQRIEKSFQVTIPDRLIAEAETLNDIVLYLQSNEATVVNPTVRQVMSDHGEKVEVDTSTAQSLIDVLMLHASTTPNKVHVYFQTEEGTEEPLTYGELLSQSLRVAEGLKANGLKEGETVAIMQPTHFAFFYSFFGTLLAGGVPVPIYPPFRAHMIESYARTEAHILNSAGVRVLITFNRAEKLSRLLQSFVPSLKLVTTVDELLKYSELQQPFQAKSEHFAFIQYTSGSTNDPKGVLLSHANLLANIRAYGKAINVQASDVTVSWLPLYHDFGLIGAWLGSLFYGVPLILLTPFSFLNHPERWLWAVHYHRGTISGAPNFAYELCIRKVDHSKIEGLDLSSWRLVANAAEKVYPNTLQQFNEKFAKYGLTSTALTPVYGLAESTVCLAVPEMNAEYRLDHVDRKQFEEERLAVSTTDIENCLTFVDCGKALHEHEMRVTNDDNVVLADRQVGNLQFRGPSNMQGYYNNPKATAGVYHDGWIDSGDLAYLVDGSVFITGRRKDLIIKAGRNLYPVEIEEIVGGIAGVRQGSVVAFAVNDTTRGTEQLVIVAETKEKDKRKLQEIENAINDAVAVALDIVPDNVVLVAPRIVPKTSSGKLQRAACKKMYLSGKLNRWQIPPWLQIAKLATQSFYQKAWRAVGYIGKLFYTAYAVIGVLITLIPMYLIVLLTPANFAERALRVWFRTILLLSFCPTKFIGIDNITKKNPMVYAANHSSYFDVIISVIIAPPGTRFVGKKELFSIPVIGSFMKRLNYLPIDRADMTKGLEDTKLIANTLKAGHSIFIFPEGTFGYAEGLRPFRMGAFKIAAEANVPICPIAIQGTRKILREDERMLRPGKIVVTVSEPIMPTGTEWQAVTQLRQAVRAEIAAHCGEPSLDFISSGVVAVKRREL